MKITLVNNLTRQAILLNFLMHGLISSYSYEIYSLQMNHAKPILKCKDNTINNTMTLSSIIRRITMTASRASMQVMPLKVLHIIFQFPTVIWESLDFLYSTDIYNLVLEIFMNAKCLKCTGQSNNQVVELLNFLGYRSESDRSLGNTKKKCLENNTKSEVKLLFKYLSQESNLSLIIMNFHKCKIQL